MDIVFETDQLRARCGASSAAGPCAARPAPARELAVAAGACSLVREAQQRRGIRSLLARHYSLLARKVAERSAETGEHYITATAPNTADMLRAAAMAAR